MAWIRKIQFFNWGYALGIILIIFTTLFICTFSLKHFGEKDKGFEPFNSNNFWDTIGFSFYGAFEGIGTLLPIMKETRYIKNFPNIVKCALITLSIYYTAFGIICYLYFGNIKTSPIVLDDF
jgi:amino acid permease